MYIKIFIINLKTIFINSTGHTDIIREDKYNKKF